MREAVCSNGGNGIDNEPERQFLAKDAATAMDPNGTNAPGKGEIASEEVNMFPNSLGGTPASSEPPREGEFASEELNMFSHSLVATPVSCSRSGRSFWLSTSEHKT